MSEPASPSAQTALRLAVAAAVLAAIVYFRAPISAQIQALAEWVKTLGPWGPLVFIALYVAAAVAFVPGSILTVSAGAIFGLWAGTVYVFIGATIAACVSFALARGVLRSAIEQRLENNPRLGAIDRAIAAEGRKIVFLLRLSPLFPFSLGNYALGLTRVSFADYALACLGMLPWTFVYVYLGSLAGDLALGWKVVGLLITGVGVFLAARLAKRALDRATAEGAG
jgi:uncharacterized membrane protein YdjX (TVP38/TMEM64 family)